MYGKLVARNLNRFVVLGVLLEEANVSRAAKRLGLTQSATSHALAALRNELDDQLLLRSSRGMILTDYARSLLPELQNALACLQQAVTTKDCFEPRSSARSFALAVADFLAAPLGRELGHQLARKLPRGSLRLEPARLENLSERLASREIDLAIAPPVGLDPAIESEVIYEEPWVTAVSLEHPWLSRSPRPKALSLEQFVAFEHGLVSPTGRGTSVVDTQLASLGLQRRILVRFSNFSIAGAALPGSKWVLTAPRTLFRGLERKVRLFVPPVEIPPLRLALHVERARASSAELRWFTAEVRKAVRITCE